MQDLLASVASALSHDPVLATYALAWVALDIWGAVTLVLAYRSRLQERGLTRAIGPDDHRPLSRLVARAQGQREVAEALEVLHPELAQPHGEGNGSPYVRTPSSPVAVDSPVGMADCSGCCTGSSGCRTCSRCGAWRGEP